MQSEKKNILISSLITKNLEDISQKLDVLNEYIKRHNIDEDIQNMQTEITQENLWDDHVKAAKLMQNFNHKKKFISDYQYSRDSLSSLKDMLKEIDEDDPFILEIQSESKNLLDSVDKLYIATLFTDQYDDNPCIIAVAAGSGGLEAEDWSKMLFNMYYNYGKHSKVYTYEIIRYEDKDAIRLVGAPGTFPYGRLKGEHGVHRLVRPSPFNANNNRHTSFASVSVIPVVNDEISIQILDSDLRIDTYRASGAGGQHVNKTDSAVRITHIPTGIVAQSQTDRSQHRNRAEAMQSLKMKLLILAEEEKRKNLQILSGDKVSIGWGNQIRSYVLDDSRVKDIRTNFESPQPDKILGGDIDDFLDAYIKWATAAK